jgi:polysaccharide biosynthesis protein PslH
VDASYYVPNPLIQPAPLSLVFTGSMDWLPNDDAIWYFVQEILPLVRAVKPDVRLTIVGRNPFPRLRELAENDPGIEVTGRVDDVRPYIDRAAAYVIPLRIGGGTRLKVFEAMAMEKAIVSTSIGVEGLRVTDGEDVLIADSPRAFAQAVLRVLIERDFAATLGRRAGAKVRTEFGWTAVAESFSRICQRTVTRADGRLVVAA